MTLRVIRHLSLKAKLLLLLAAAMAITGPVAFGVVRAAQTPSTQSTAKPDSQTAAGDITGQWQGTLNLQQDIRVILVIAKDNGALKGTMYEYVTEAQGAQPFKVPSLSLNGSTFTFAFGLSGLTYEGQLSADGNTITGTWTQHPTLDFPAQGPPTHPLVLVRANKTTAWEIPALPPPPKMMPAGAEPSVEVATIKPNNSDIRMKGLGWNGRAFGVTAASVDDLIMYAYQVQAKQIVGGPSWMSSERYDVVAVPDVKGSPTSEQERSIVRSLLVNRFQLKFHKETRDMSAFVLTVHKGGAKIAHTQINSTLAGFGMRPATGGLTLMMSNVSMPIFAYILEREPLVDRPVVDHTSLQGRFDFTLTFLPDETQFNGHSPIGKLADGIEPAPPFFEALEQQLGLKLSAAKTAVEVLAIDHVEKPSPN